MEQCRPQVDAAKIDHPAVPDDDVSSLAAGLLLANAKIATLEQTLHQEHLLIQQALQEQHSTFQKEIQKLSEAIEQIRTIAEQQEQRQADRLLAVAKDTSAIIEASSGTIMSSIEQVEKSLYQSMSAVIDLIRSVDSQNQQRIETLRGQQQVMFLRLVIIQVVLATVLGTLLFILSR